MPPPSINLIDWSPWSASAFERARIEDRPVLLTISAAWCHGGHEMDRTSYVDPRVVRLVRDHFVPIRVDADRRPDITDRYGLAGLPCTLFLTSDARIIGGGTFVATDRLADVLERVARAYGARRAEIDAAGDPMSDAGGAVSGGVADETLLVRVFDSFDDRFGGFGSAPKFPLTAPLELALLRCRRSSDPDMERVIRTTLDAMGWGGLYDDVDGGFFRCAATRDWRLPHEEKLLDVNASLLRVYLEAGELLDVSRYRDRALEVLRYTATWLTDTEAGGWWGSQCGDHEYYASATADARRARTAPAVDRVLYANWNAGMASAVLHASRVLDDEALAVFALKSLERVLLACYRPGSGVAHYYDGAAQIRGLLADQVAMLTAVLDAYDVTGDIVYEMMAEELAHFMVRALWDGGAGGFFDRAPDESGEAVGLLGRPVKPFVSNCEAARALRRLAAVSGEHAFADRASDTLASVRAAALAQGPLAAHYLLAAGDGPGR